MSEAKNASQINTIFKKFKRVTSIMVIMTQPKAPKATPVRICSFGTDNRFTSDDVKNRLKTIRAELETIGIQVLTYSADGDSRKMKVMRQSLQLGFSKQDGEGMKDPSKCLAVLC
jgi:hypothetical protein